MWSRVVVVALFLLQSALTLLLLTGHAPWAGPVIWKATPTHGLNVGDVPLLGLWLVGAVFCLRTVRRS